MTKSQQLATKTLQSAQRTWLKAYGWLESEGGGWHHPKLKYLVARMSTHDAMEQTRADATLGWP